ncbi:MAG TPA: aspartate aminotransferase family protein, partial [Polyangiaceae bacterium]
VIRQRGLMVGVDLKTSTRALSIMRALLARGYVVLTGGRGGEALTLTPPLDVPFELLEGFATALGEVLEKQS